MLFCSECEGIAHIFTTPVLRCVCSQCNHSSAVTDEMRVVSANSKSTPNFAPENLRLHKHDPSMPRVWEMCENCGKTPHIRIDPIMMHMEFASTDEELSKLLFVCSGCSRIKCQAGK
jgi:hypothetical protein